MSAHCDTCGTDLVYGEGDDWQIMRCRVCDLRDDLRETRRLGNQLADVIKAIAAEDGLLDSQWGTLDAWRTYVKP